MLQGRELEEAAAVPFANDIFVGTLRTNGLSTDKDRKLLGEGIRKYRKLEGLTQEKLAEKVDVNPVYLGQIECGYKVPTVDVLLRIARALKVRMRDIVHEL